MEFRTSAHRELSSWTSGMVVGAKEGIVYSCYIIPRKHEATRRASDAYLFVDEIGYIVI